MNTTPDHMPEWERILYDATPCRPDITASILLPWDRDPRSGLTSGSSSRYLWLMVCRHTTAYGTFADLVDLATEHVLGQRIGKVLAR